MESHDREYFASLNGTPLRFSYKLTDAPGFCAEVYLHNFAAHSNESLFRALLQKGIDEGKCTEQSAEQIAMGIITQELKHCRASHLVLGDLVGGWIDKYIISKLPQQFETDVPYSEGSGMREGKYPWRGSGYPVLHSDYHGMIAYEKKLCRVVTSEQFRNRNSSNRVVRCVIKVGDDS